MQRADDARLPGEAQAAVRRLDLVSVVIPMHNAAATIPAQLEALAEQDYPGGWEVVVIDNQSTDDSVAQAHRYQNRFASLRVCAANEGIGAAVARNRGVAEARGDLLAFCDADDVATPGWLRELVAVAGTADIVAGRELRVVDDGDGRLRARPGQHDHGAARPPHLSFLPFAVGGNAAVWRDVVDDVGGWRTDFLRGQDAEFSWRVQTAGYRFSYAPGAVMNYRDRPTLLAAMHQHYVWGIHDARLVALYRTAGCPQTSWSLVSKRLLWLCVHLPDVARSRWHRLAYLKTVAGCAGRVRGSIRHRVRLF